MQNTVRVHKGMLTGLDLPIGPIGLDLEAHHAGGRKINPKFFFVRKFPSKMLWTLIHVYIYMPSTNQTPVRLNRLGDAGGAYLALGCLYGHVSRLEWQ